MRFGQKNSFEKLNIRDFEIAKVIDNIVFIKMTVPLVLPEPEERLASQKQSPREPNGSLNDLQD
jgi:hypothetical protein